MQVLDAPGATPAGLARRSVAVGCNAAFLAVVVVLAARFVAGVVQEKIPASIAPTDVCSVLDREQPTTWCTVRGDRVYYSAKSDPLLRIAAVALVASFANSVVAPWATGSNLGRRLLGLRVHNRATGGALGFRTHLLRWVGWPVSSFGAVVTATTAPASTGRASSTTIAPGDGSPVARDPLLTEGS